MPHVRIPVPLRTLTGDASVVDVAGATVGEALDSLFAQHPDLAAEVSEDGELKTSTYESFNLLVGREEAGELQGRDTPLAPDQSVMLLRTWPAAISGGKQWNQDVGSAPPD